MKHTIWIPVASLTAMLALAGCDQAQTPSGQATGTANEQNTSPEDMEQQGTTGQSGSQSGADDAAQSSTDTGTTDWSNSIAVIGGESSGSSRNWTLISQAPETGDDAGQANASLIAGGQQPDGSQSN